MVDFESVRRIDEVERRARVRSRHVLNPAERRTRCSQGSRNARCRLRVRAGRRCRHRRVDRGSPISELAIDPPRAYRMSSASRIAATWRTSSSGPFVIRREAGRYRPHRQGHRHIGGERARDSTWIAVNVGWHAQMSARARRSTSRQSCCVSSARSANAHAAPTCHQGCVRPRIGVVRKHRSRPPDQGNELTPRLSRTGTARSAGLRERGGRRPDVTREVLVDRARAVAERRAAW